MLRKLLGDTWEVPPGRPDILRKPAAEIVDSVLRYLERRERCAEVKLRPGATVDYRLTWAFMWELHYGADDTYRRFYGPALTVQQPLPSPEPRARAYKETRPLRRVIARVEFPPAKLESGRKCPQYRERLSCGHTLPVRVDYFGEKPAQHRRCGECVTAEIVARVVKSKAAEA